jgi:phosphatidate cytidylyltransferase
MTAPSDLALLAVFVLLAAVNAVRALAGIRFPLDSYLRRIWLLFLFLAAARFISFTAGIWVLAAICFTALREYFSLIDIRLQDRLAILLGYISIPFMIYYIQSGWYNMFIITIPVYGFLAVPLLVALGGRETRGTIFSVGAIDLGLFLFVYCLGHIGYLARFSIWAAALVILCVAICDAILCELTRETRSGAFTLVAGYFLPLPLTAGVSLLLAGWAGIPLPYAVSLGALIPLLVLMGHRTIEYVKADLGVDDAMLLPGRGEILDSMKSFFYAAPISFHFYKYFCT